MDREDIRTGGVATCVFCGETVEEVQDPYSFMQDYGQDGDFGCAGSPWTDDEVTGSHVPYSELGRLYVLESATRERIGE